MNARLFVHHRTSPYFNMAFDEWMLASAAQTPGSLFWRLYTWEPGAITFGFNQRSETALDFNRVGQTPVIRRITGGRAVYHDVSELTYAVAFNSAFPPTPRLAGPASQSSEVIARLLSRFLGETGINTTWVRKSAVENSSPDFFHKAACFASHAKYELIAGGAKIVASARRDWNGAALQHGSIKVNGLAPHPALHQLPAGSKENGKAIERLSLSKIAKTFTEIVGAELGGGLRESELREAESQAIGERMELVLTCPIAQRELIAHSINMASP